MKKEQQTYNAALYCRLSRDDDSSGDSMSISTQKQLLTDFAVDNGYNIFSTYIDDYAIIGLRIKNLVIIRGLGLGFIFFCQALSKIHLKVKKYYRKGA